MRCGDHLRPAALLLALCAWVASCTGGDGQRPNLILVTVDTLRSDHLSAYGYERETSPHLDRFANDAVRFTNAVAPQPLTRPSIASLFTARYPYQHGVSDNQSRLPETAETLAERLRAAGYNTAAFVSSFVLKRDASRLDQGFDTYDETLDRYVLGGAERGATATAAQVAAWLREPPREPFFLWVHLMDPHGPYVPPPPFDRRYEALERGSRRIPRSAIPAYQYSDTLDPSVYVDRYDGEIAHTDNEFGGILAVLRERSLYDGAAIVFHADHGENLGEGGAWFGHGSRLYESGLRIPLLLKLPGSARATKAAQNEQLVSVLDIAPTLLAIAGIDPLGGTAGRSLLDLPEGVEHHVYVEAHSRRAALSGVRGSDRMLVRRRVPGERAVVGEEYLRGDQHGRIEAQEDTARASLAARLDRFEAQSNPARSRSAPESLRPDEEEALRTLGYLE